MRSDHIHAQAGRSFALRSVQTLRQGGSFLIKKPFDFGEGFFFGISYGVTGSDSGWGEAIGGVAKPWGALKFTPALRLKLGV